MCPACMATLVLIASGSASTGGLTAFLAKKIGKASRQEKFDRKKDSKGGSNGTTHSRFTS